jgi:hypothetical protein
MLYGIECYDMSALECPRVLRAFVSDLLFYALLTLFLKLQIEHFDLTVEPLDFYSGDTWFESCPNHRSANSTRQYVT